MSLEINPIPTASAMARAMDYSETGLKIEAKYIVVGKGFQEIQIDAAGRAITDTLKTPVAFLEILSAVEVSDYQHQLTVDAAGVVDYEFNLSEMALADEDKNIIAIYGHPNQALMSISPAVDSALIAMNMVLALFPAGSIEIIHQGAPIELFLTAEKAALDYYIGTTTLEMMRSYDRRRADELLEAERRRLHDEQMAEVVEGQNELINELTAELSRLADVVSVNRENQRVFNHNTEISVGTLSGALVG